MNFGRINILRKIHLPILIRTETFRGQNFIPIRKCLKIKRKFCKIIIGKTHISERILPPTPIRMGSSLGRNTMLTRRALPKKNRNCPSITQKTNPKNYESIDFPIFAFTWNSTLKFSFAQEKATKLQTTGIFEENEKDALLFTNDQDKKKHYGYNMGVKEKVGNLVGKKVKLIAKF